MTELSAMQEPDVNQNKSELSIEALLELTASVGFAQRAPEKWVAALERDSLVAFIEEEDKLVAFGILEGRGDDRIIFDMCVRPDLQNSGLGSKIIHSLLGQAKEAGYAKVGLSAWSENPDAREFYEKFGFKDAESSVGFTNYMEATID